MSSTTTPEERAEERWPWLEAVAKTTFDYKYSLGLLRRAHAICIREEVEPLEAELQKAIEARESTRRWYGARWQRMDEWMRSPEMRDTEACHKWFSIVANGMLIDDPPNSFMADVNLTRYRAEKAEAEVAKLRASGNRMCALLCLFYKEAHATLPDDARKDLVSMVNEWAEVTGQKEGSPTNTNN